MALHPSDRLWDEHRIVARPVGGVECVRVASDFFNTEEELDKLVDAVSGMVA